MTPPRSVVFRRIAAKQIEDAHLWWQEHRPAVPDAIREEIVRAVGLIAVQPGIGSVATNPRLRGVRRILLSRVSYFLYYHPMPDRIDVRAFWHAKRGSDPR